MRYVSSGLGLILCGCWATALASPPPPDSDLTADPLVTYGLLSNGVRYAIRPRSGSTGRISLRLVVDAGSLDESDRQRGLAHLLEHMAFNGSTHFPAGTIVEYLQRQGMAIGADANANTSYDRTIYLLELRHNDPAAIGEGLQIFHDFSGALDLPAPMLAKERGIVLSEKLSRDSVTARGQAAQLDFCLAGTLLPRRVTIGDEGVIAHADQRQLREFYDAWYRPDRITVVAVGDFDPTVMAQEIKAQFGHLRAHGRAGSPPPFGTIANAPGVHVKFIGDSELPGTSINFTVLSQQPAPPDSADTRLRELPRQMAFLMFNRRLAALAAGYPAPFSDAGALCSEQLSRFRETSLTVATPGRGWQTALTAGEHELRRALQFGFQPAELKVATAVFAQQLEQAAASAPTLSGARIANNLVDSLRAGQVFMTPADYLSLVTPALSQMSIATCNRAFRDAWQSPARFVTVTGNSVIAGSPDAVVGAAYRTAAAEPVAEVAAAERRPWSYTEFGPPGALVQKRRVESPGVLLGEFGNGVRVNLKSTRFEANRIRIEVRVGTGRLQEPVRQPGLSLLAEEMFLAGGLNRYRTPELLQLLSGKTVSLNFAVGEDAFQFSAVTDREDLLLQLQLIAATLTDSAFRPEAQSAALARIGGLYSNLGHTAAGPVTAMIPRLLASNDARFGLPSFRETNHRTGSEVRAWLEPQLKSGPLEITLVGDIGEEEAISAVGQTLGALGPRQLPHSLEPQRLIAFPAPPLRWNYTVRSEIPAACVAAYWPTDAPPDEPRRDRLEVLAAILQDRIRVRLREELSATYVPETSSVAPAAFPGYGYIRAQVTVDPAKAAIAAASITALAEDLSRHGVTADELARIRGPLAGRAHDLEHSNAYWATALAQIQALPYTLDWARVRPTDLDSITQEELSALARFIFQPGQLCVAIVTPVKS